MFISYSKWSIWAQVHYWHPLLLCLTQQRIPGVVDKNVTGLFRLDELFSSSSEYCGLYAAPGALYCWGLENQGKGETTGTTGTSTTGLSSTTAQTQESSSNTAFTYLYYFVALSVLLVTL